MSIWIYIPRSYLCKKSCIPIDLINMNNTLNFPLFFWWGKNIWKEWKLHSNLDIYMFLYFLNQGPFSNGIKKILKSNFIVNLEITPKSWKVEKVEKVEKIEKKKSRIIFKKLNKVYLRWFTNLKFFEGFLSCSFSVNSKNIKSDSFREGTALTNSYNIS